MVSRDDRIPVEAIHSGGLSSRSLLGGRGVSCSLCAHRSVCVPMPLVDTNLMPIFESALLKEVVLDVGEELVPQSRSGRSLFIVKSGSVKTQLESDLSGIVAMYFASEVIAFSALGAAPKDQKKSYAMERAHICEMDYVKMEELFQRFPKMHLHFTHLLGRQYDERMRLLATIRSGTVEQKAIAFLLYMCRKTNNLNAPVMDFVLPMGRPDISAFLGISAESLSRTLTVLSKKRLINIFNRRVTISDFDKMEAML